MPSEMTDAEEILEPLKWPVVMVPAEDYARLAAELNQAKADLAEAVRLLKIAGTHWKLTGDDWKELEGFGW